MTFFQASGLVLMFLTQGFLGLQWTLNTETKSEILACGGDDVTFPWFFSLDDGEEVEDIKWLHLTPGSDAPALIADLVSGTFITVPSYAGSLSYLANATVELSGVTARNSGNYTAIVSVHKGGAFSSIRHTISVIVSDPPSFSERWLSVVQSDQVVYDSAGNFHVQLVCGHFASRGVPPVDVIWRTPTGAEVASSFHDKGNFHLFLDNPVKGGYYECRLPPEEPATRCLLANESIFVNMTENPEVAAWVDVDALRARLSLLEIKEEELREQNGELRTENQRLKEELTRANATLTENILSLQAAGGSLMRASFQAGLSHNLHANSTGPIKFDAVSHNEGDAYDPATGEFKAPVNGTYFFILTTAPYGTGQKNDVHVLLDGAVVARVQNSYPSTSAHSMATAHVSVCLVEGQILSLRNNGDMYYSASLSFLTGFLIHPGC